VKLLFDQNLAPSLVARFQELYPGSSHVRLVGLHRAPDAEVWIYARDQGYTVVSKDADFHQMSFLLGAPPKVIWIRRGNCSVAEIGDILLASRATIRQFEDDEEAALLILS
jgi:predicted nuclease of predicted toxin-antitoxin system